MIQLEENKLIIEIHTNDPTHLLYSFQQALLHLIGKADASCVENHTLEYSCELLKELSLEYEHLKSASAFLKKAA